MRTPPITPTRFCVFSMVRTVRNSSPPRLTRAAVWRKPKTLNDTIRVLFIRTEPLLMEAQTLLALPVVLALELVEGEVPPRLSLDRDEAAELVELIAADLHGLVPQVNQARLALA